MNQTFCSRNPEQTTLAGKRIGKTYAVRVMSRRYLFDGRFHLVCELFDPRVVKPEDARPTLPFTILSVTDEDMEDQQFVSERLHPLLLELVNEPYKPHSWVILRDSRRGWALSLWVGLCRDIDPLDWDYPDGQPATVTMEFL